MGCDIHIVVEGKKKGKDRWIGIYCTDFLKFKAVPISERNYEFFAEIASVRGTSKSRKYPQNLPEDISDLAWAQYMTAPTDYHSASYMSLDSMVVCWLLANPNRKTACGIEVRDEFAVFDLFGNFSPDEDWSEFRAVFWFDN